MSEYMLALLLIAAWWVLKFLVVVGIAIVGMVIAGWLFICIGAGVEQAIDAMRERRDGGSDEPA